MFPDKHVKYNFRPDWLKNLSTGQNLELDIYFPEIALAIEVNGFSHLHNFQKERDKIKSILCKDRGIFLITISDLSELFTSFTQRILRRYKADFSKIPVELFQEIANYKPSINKELTKRVIWKAKQFKWHQSVKRYNLLQMQEKGYKQ